MEVPPRRKRLSCSSSRCSGILVLMPSSTNIPLHRELLHDSRFLRGGTSIHYLEQKLAQESKQKVK